MVTVIDWKERLASAGPVWAGGGVLAVLAMLLVLLLNPGFVVNDAAGLLERQAGLRLTSSGARIQFLPELAVVIEQPRLSSPDGNGTDLLQAQSAVVAIPWRSLVTRRFRPTTAELENPVINIVAGPKGNNLWSKRRDAIDRVLTQDNLDDELLKLVTKNGTFKFLDESKGQAFEVRQADLQISLDRTGAVSLTGHAALSNQFARIEAQFASLARLSEDGTPIDATLTAPALGASFSGLLTLRQGLELAGTFSAEAADSRKLAEWIGLQGLSKLQPAEVKASGPLLVKAGLLRSDDISVATGSQSFKGKLSVGRTGPRLAIGGTLSTNKLQFKAPGGNWSTTPLQIDWIKDLDLNLEISCFGLSWGDMATGPLALFFKSNEGLLDITLEKTPLLGGEVAGTLTINASSTPGRAALSLQGNNIELSSLPGVTAVTGTGNVETSVTSEGGTIEEMISTLEGDARVAMPEAEIRGFDLPASISAAAGQEQRGWIAAAASRSAVSGLTASFTFKDGIGATNDLQGALAGEKLGAKGTVDLLRRAVDLTLKPVKAAAKPAAIRIFGAWGNPVLGPPASEPDASAGTSGKPDAPAAN